MKQLFLLLFCLIACLASMFSQGFQITYPASTSDLGVLLKEDGGVFNVLGVHSSNFTLGRISLDGDLLQWEENITTIGTSWTRFDWTSDGGWVCAGIDEVTSYDNDVKLSKFDSEGNQEWQVIFGDESDERPFSIVETIDGSFYINCNLWNSNGQDRVYKVDANGNVLWSIDFSMEGSTSQIVPTEDGGCIALYVKTLSGTERYDNLIKLSPTGTIEWQTLGNRTGNSFPQKILRRSNGNFVIGAKYASNTLGELYLSEYTSEGVSVWTLVFEDSDPNSSDDDWAGLTAITETSNEDFLITGLYDTGTNNTTAFLSKITSQGEMLWVEMTNESVVLRDVKEGEDGNIYAVGSLSHDSSSDLLFLKTNNLGVFSNNSLSGQIFQDFELDCTNDSIEFPLFHWLVEANGSLTTHYASSNLGGEFHMRTQVDDYELRVYSMSPYWEPCQNNISLSFTESSQEEALDFPIQPVVICPWLELSMVGPCNIRPGATSFYVVDYCNYGTETATNVQLTINLPSEVSIIDATESFNQIGQTLVFSLEDVGVMECKEVRIYFELETNVSLNTILCADANITPNDICLPDYTGNIPTIDQQCAIVVGSFDPNIKLGNPIGNGEDHLIPTNKELSYTIQFQNTGTDTAFRVVLLDTLPEQLDVTTFRPGASSHPFQVQVLGTGVLKFVFDPIALVDSLTNEELSQGFVRFSIDQKPDLPIGTLIENSAAIYFDFNAPVITEPWIYTIGVPNQIEEPELTLNANIYPNPFNGILNIDHKKLTDWSEIYLYDSQGQFLLRKELSTIKHAAIDLNHLDSGFYFYKIESNNIVFQVGKIIKH